MSSLMYVAATRAKHMLYIMVKEDDPDLEKFHKAVNSIDSTGGMVLEGSSSDFEFIGRVSHYNPNRVGWLSVSDPAFQSNKIMFFPFDVNQAGINQLKVGDRLKFRPKPEGGNTIASDLRPTKEKKAS